ncbi:MAG TPA: ABC transporter permease [Cyclobacteriaceae bacterium]|nr:ABC transporter permease [Cyclobacteriaceae bacterium]
MFKNYFKVALRNLTKHKFFSFINIFGLTVGITSCLLIFIYVTDELSFDKFHANASNIYRIGLHGKIAGQEIFTTNSCVPVGPAMKNEIPGIESMTRVDPVGRAGIVFKNEDRIFTEKEVIYADSNFFKFFDFKLIEGNRETLLNQPGSAVISSSLAKKYFDGAAMGKTLIIGNDKKAYKVTGVAEECPTNSHLKFDAVLSYNSVLPQIIAQNNSAWTNNSMYTYVQKNPLTKVEEVNAKLENMIERYVGKELEKFLGVNFAEFRKGGGIYSYAIYPVTDSHLHPFEQDDTQPAGDIRYVYIFSGVGLFILLLACINFMNLSTAQSAGRAKEVGLRKTLGSLRAQLIGQFLSESFIFSVTAVLLAIGCCYIALPYFNALAGKQLTLAALTTPAFFGAAFALILVVGFLAGSYPAFYLTSFSVVEVVKGKIRAGMKSKGVRSALVVVQFAVSTLLIVATAVVYMQLTYMQDKDLGLDKSNVLIVQNMDRLEKTRMAFRNEVKNLAGVQSVSFTNNSFPGVNNTTVFREKGNKVDHLTGRYLADWDQLDVLKFKMSAGRFFSRDFKTDTSTAVVNEAFVKEFGWSNPIGQEVLDFSGNNDPSKPEVVKVIGVVKDFNFETLKDKVRPIIVRLAKEGRVLLVRYDGNPRQLTESIEKIWRQSASGEPFEFSFMDDGFDKLFRAEQRLRNLFTVFSMLAISIACLGLFALAAFTTEQRTKEIGIRKTMGASVAGLTFHLSKEFMVLVLIAMIPAIGFGWYLADSWLADFPYRIGLSPLMFLGAALVAVVIAGLTVSYQSLKAANAKPVNSLRYE